MESPALPEEFAQLLTELHGVEPARMSPSATFESLGVDSLALMELVVAAEEQFDLVLPEQAMDLTPAATLEEAAAVLSGAVPAQRPADAPSPLAAP